MQLTDSYEPAGQDVVSEEIDGEVIIVNLKNGNYYSLTQSATVIWSRLARGETLEQIHGALCRRYLGEPGVMQQGLTDLIRALETEELIRRAAPRADGNGAPPAEAAVDGPEPYLPPLFERFTDMGDLLLLDPVHEVEDQKGWPHSKGDA